LTSVNRAGILALKEREEAMTNKGWDSSTMPKGCGARDFVVEQTVAQIGRMNIFGISGGRVNVLRAKNRIVGLELPVGQSYKVRIFLDADDTYVVQRVWREIVKGEVRGIYFDQVGEVAYQAGMFQSTKDFGEAVIV
jgi:hypothetical protein